MRCKRDPFSNAHSLLSLPLLADSLFHSTRKHGQNTYFLIPRKKKMEIQAMKSSVKCNFPFSSNSLFSFQLKLRSSRISRNHQILFSESGICIQKKYMNRIFNSRNKFSEKSLEINSTITTTYSLQSHKRDLGRMRCMLNLNPTFVGLWRLFPTDPRLKKNNQNEDTPIDKKIENDLQIQNLQQTNCG